MDCDPVGDFGSRPETLGTVVLETFVNGVARNDTWLDDVTVVGAADGRIELTGRVAEFRHEQPGYEIPAGDGFRMGPDYDTTLVRFRTVEGVFRYRPELDTPPVTLRGFRPEPWFLDKMIKHDNPVTGVPADRPLQAVTLAGPRLTATIEARSADGRLIDTLLRGIFADIQAVRPSALGDGLFDVDLDEGAYEVLPTAARPLWDTWLRQRPTEAGTWVSVDPGLRHHWLLLALGSHRHGVPDRPAGATFHLDGTLITDLSAFHCALGEAVNGPGGYFGWGLDALNDCLTGRWGVEPPFKLIWTDAGSSRRALGDEVFTMLTALLTEQGRVELHLR